MRASLGFSRFRTGFLRFKQLVARLLVTSDLLAKREKVVVDGIPVYLLKPDFCDRWRVALEDLRAKDTVGYARVKNRVRGIVEFGKPPYHMGLLSGYFLDGWSERDVVSTSAAWHAGRLVRFATHQRIVDELGIADAVFSQTDLYRRILLIATARELRTCEALGAPDWELRQLRTWRRRYRNREI
jgi:hypothetical protein